ncbi:hypothetical protein W02_42850 [Nitrospira sp. KM1]|nr:hypothetical protein W02_42850 [Nitrospira sp. KM1]
MRQAKFTETQIVSILKEADAGRPVNEIWRHYGISSATYDKWKAKYGGLEASDVKRLKELEHENNRLKRLYAALSLEMQPSRMSLQQSSKARGAPGDRHALGHGERSADPAGRSSDQARASHLLPSAGRLGTAGSAGHGRAHDLGGREEPLGLLEMLWPLAA